MTAKFIPSQVEKSVLACMAASTPPVLALKGIGTGTEGTGAAIFGRGAKGFRKEDGGGQMSNCPFLVLDKHVHNRKRCLEDLVSR